ncbi:hypothetical protein C0991_000623 [Blastosporella zonata]|nr:hypothetical protein C0991_000623 [Blastosporella zonata]
MNVLDHHSKSNSFDDFQSQFDNLTISSHSPSALSSDLSSAYSSPNDSPKAACFLGPPFSMSYNRYPSRDFDDGPLVIDTFSPKPLMHDLSPTSSDSSIDLDSPFSSPCFSFEAFVNTRSRVVRLYNLPRLAESYLSALFLPQSTLRGQRPMPISLWTTREEYGGRRPDSIWAVFKTHEEAASALSLSSPAMSVTTALESDLEPFHKLRRFALDPPPPPTPTRLPAPASHQLRVSSSQSDLRRPRPAFDHSSSMDSGDYTLSSNPPNPRTSFRLGDWIRNLTCIGCGCPRSNGPNAPTAPAQQQQSYQTNRNLSSPRFASYSSLLPNPPVQPAAPQQQPLYSSYNYPQKPVHAQQQQQQQPAYHSTPPAPSAKPAHPLLTPSGRAFAVGGKVQNISSDPLSPCIMYWPDNEPFPEQGQIRPSNVYSQQPPILNTGNRGPISHQPDAEGNGDSISAAVQAERIALLTSVLAQSQAQAAVPQASLQAPRSHSLTPPQQRRAFIDVSPPQPQLQTSHAPVHRSHSHYELGAQYNNREASPIYQTSGNRQRQPSPLYSTGPDFRSLQLPVHAPAPLLPSFLQDMVQSPALSPTSTSSADLSFEEYDDRDMLPIKTSFPRNHSGSDASSTDSSIGNIWRLDGEESKSLSAFALPNRQDLIGSGKRNSREGLHLQVIL